MEPARGGWAAGGAGQGAAAADGVSVGVGLAHPTLCGTTKLMRKMHVLASESEVRRRVTGNLVVDGSALERGVKARVRWDGVLGTPVIKTTVALMADPRFRVTLCSEW